MQPVGVVGNLSLDSVDGGPVRIGGGPFYAAQALAALDRPSRVVARCAEGDRAMLAAELGQTGAPVSVLPGRSTARFALHYHGERREIVVESPGDVWTAADARRAAGELDGCEWVHVAPLLRSDFPAETLAELGRGRRLSLDGQGLVRAPGRGPLRLDADFDRAALRAVETLKLAEDEARALLGDLEGEPVARLGVPVVIVTFGARGSIVFVDGQRHDVRADPVLGVDQTGAGDVFATGYVARRADGLGPLDAARSATALVRRLLLARPARTSAPGGQSAFDPNMPG